MTRFLRPPQPVSRGWTSGEWADWLIDTGAIRSVRASDHPACRVCRRPTKTASNGAVYDTCYDCGFHIKDHLQRAVPISYAFSPLLTTLIWQSKNETGREWLNYALASLLHRFLQLHWSCLERAAGGPIDAVVPLPSHPSTRGGRDHILEIYTSLSGWPAEQNWSAGTLTKTTTQKAEDRRGSVDPDLFTLNRNVIGERILLIDDMFTTGGTLASAAAALRRAGTYKPIAVTLGRQINPTKDENKQLLTDLRGRLWEPNSCAVEPAER